MMFFFKQKTAYEMRISDWSSDVCSSDLPFEHAKADGTADIEAVLAAIAGAGPSDAVLLHAACHNPTGIDYTNAERSAERRVGKEWVSTCRSRWSPYH